MRLTFLSFHPRQLLLFIIVFFTLFFCNNDIIGQIYVAKDIEIVIEKGDTATGILTLYPTDTAYAYRNKKVTWTIGKTATNVSSFRIVKKDISTSTEIFSSSERPPNKHTKKGYGRVKKNSLNNTIYGYNIYWIDSLNPNKEYKFDPQISVKPSYSKYLDWILYMLTGFVLLFLSGFTYRKIKKRRNRIMQQKQLPK